MSDARRVILARRARFLAATLAVGATAAPAVARAEDAGADADAADAGDVDDAGDVTPPPQVCLSVVERPRACLCAVGPSPGNATPGYLVAPGLAAAAVLAARRQRKRSPS